MQADERQTNLRGTLLLTGATGFVGGRVLPALAAAGWRVRALTRDAGRASGRAGGTEWVQGDLNVPMSYVSALQGCRAALYLVHGIGSSSNYLEQEVWAAEEFSRLAAEAGLERIVYLGGVAPPSGTGSQHLRSRLEVGEALRAGGVTAVELRASMIVGHGSLSWLIVRDLASRLPVMVLPRWLQSRTQPVAIDDVVVALVRALDLELGAAARFDLPGPEILSGKEILEKTALVRGLVRPLAIDVPFLSPRLSSHWVHFVTRAPWDVAREVVIGLTDDLLATDGTYWDLVGHNRLSTFAEAAALALEQERKEGSVRGVWGLVERARGLGRA